MSEDQNNQDNQGIVSFAGKEVKLTPEASRRHGMGTTETVGQARYNSRTNSYSFNSGTCQLDFLNASDFIVVSKEEKEATFVKAQQASAIREIALNEAGKSGRFDPSNGLGLFK